MGLLHSRLYFNLLRCIATRIHFQVNFDQMVLAFKSSSKHRVRDLKLIYDHGEMGNNMGRRLTFFRFMEEIQLTDGEWDEICSLI